MSAGTRKSARAGAGATPELAPRLDIDALLQDLNVQVIVCCGSGGVGKTTTAAALGVRAAEHGRRVVVMTIDPARRLAQSLGLSELDNTPRTVEGIGAQDISTPISGASPGHLDAMMLDMKRTFDEVIEAHASPERAQQIFENPFYQALSSSFAGTQEYMAMEKLGQLRSHLSKAPRSASATQAPEGDSPESADTWDLIIVDTPPSRSALDFLDAPQRLGSFLDGRLIRLLAAPARVGGRAYLRVVSATIGSAGGMLTRIVGAQVLTDVQRFVAAMDTVFGSFRERAETTYTMLKEPGTAFLVVATPEPDALREASFFVERLAADRMPLAGLVLNRVQAVHAADLSGQRALGGAEMLLDASEHSLTAGLLEIHAERMQRQDREHAVTARFSSAHPEVPVVRVPAQASDVHDLDALRRLGELMKNR